MCVFIAVTSVARILHEGPEKGAGLGFWGYLNRLGSPETSRAVRGGLLGVGGRLAPYRFDITVRRRLSRIMPTKLRIKITSKRQATFPAAVLAAMHVKPGDYLELIQENDNWRLAPVSIDYSKLGTLRHKISADHPPLDLNQWRKTTKDHVLLRD